MYYKIPENVRWGPYIAIYMENNDFVGTTRTGIKRAKQLLYDNYISYNDAINMKNWFARHKYTSKPNYDEWIKEGLPLFNNNNNNKQKWRGAKSWLSWGGDAGMKFVNNIIRGGYYPIKYFEGLDDIADITKRFKRIKEGSKSDSNNDYSYRKWETDFNIDGSRKKTKKSQHTKKFYDMFPNARSLKDKSDKTGVPLDIIKEVYDRGVSAWRTGHRVGATKEQWGFARVHSFLTGGPTSCHPDHILREKAIKRSKKAKKHFNTLNINCV